MPNQDTRIVLDYRKNNLAVDRLVGCRETATSQAFCFGGTSTTAPATNMASYNGLNQKKLSVLDTSRHKLDFNKNNVYLDETLQYTFTYSNFVGYGNIYIGTINTSTISSGFNGEIYSCRIYNNDVLIRDFVPAMRKSDNVVGLYDRVSGTFFTNAGTGSFIAGPVV